MLRTSKMENRAQIQFDFAFFKSVRHLKTPSNRPRRRLVSMLILPALLMAALSRDAAAQSVTGSISGMVTDSQSAVLAGAEITVKNTATGVVGKTVTNGAGVYNVPYLRIGTYEVRITAPGMKEAVVTGVLVDQNNISRVDVTLELGNVNQTIQVEAAAPLLQQESTTYDGVVDRKFVEDLPVSFGGTTRDPPRSLFLCPVSWSRPRPALNLE